MKDQVSNLLAYAKIPNIKANVYSIIMDNISVTLDDSIQQAHSDYVRALDKWILLTIQKRRTDTLVIESIREVIGRNLKSNATYYRSMANESASQSDTISTNRYRILAKVHQEISN